MSSFHYDAFDSHLHSQWKADRALRRRVPLHDAWRGCLGLAMLLDRPDDTEAHGDLALVRNNQVTWLALRDVPVGRCPGSPVMNRRDVNYANTAVAELRHGMPVIDFTKHVRDAVDFRFIPVGRHARRVGPRPWDVRVRDPHPDTLDADHRSREFAVLNRVSAGMTAFAYSASDGRGRPARPAWARRRPEGDCGASTRVVPAGAWMPRAYVPVEPAAARRLGIGVPSTGGTQTPSTPAICDAFCQAVSRGLEFRAIGPEVYCGTTGNATPDRTAVMPGRRRLVRHRLRSRIDGSSRTVPLPAGARVAAAPGTELDAGAPWVSVFDKSSTHPWSGGNFARRSAIVRDICGGPSRLAHLRHVWLENQAVRLACEPGRILLPAELVAHAARELSPNSLWWDTAPAMPYYDWQLETAVFPPVAIRRWDRLRLAMSGEVALDASIGDPRFQRRSSPPSARTVRFCPADPSAAGTTTAPDRGAHCHARGAAVARLAG